MCSHSSIVLWAFFILSWNVFQFRFVCSLFVLFYWSDRNTPLPYCTNGIGDRHRFLPPASTQEPRLALPLWPPAINRWSARIALSPSGPHDQSRLSSLPLQAILEPTHQALWLSPVIPQQITCHLKPFLNRHTKTCESVPYFSSYYLPLQVIFNRHAKNFQSVPSLLIRLPAPPRNFEVACLPLWVSPIFFIRLPASPSHFGTDMPSAVSQPRHSSSDLS